LKNFDLKGIHIEPRQSSLRFFLKKSHTNRPFDDPENHESDQNDVPVANIMIKIEAIAPDLAKGFYRKITDDSPEYFGFCEIILQRGGSVIMGLWRIAQKGFVKLSCNKNGSLGLFKVFLLQNPTLKFPEITLQRFCDHGALVDCNKSGSLGLFKVFLLQDRTLKYTIISALQPMGQTIPNLQRTKIDGF
jgi:hypothetical protein